MSDKWDERKKALEEEYFRRQEQQAIKNMQRQSALGRCPKCGNDLVAETFDELTLDCCPACGGIWLDGAILEELAGERQHGWFKRWFAHR